MKLTTKDSAVKKKYATGSKRSDTTGKGAYELVSPIFIKRIADICEAGSTYYGSRNWEKGQPLSRYMQSAMRHMFQWLEGDRTEDHIGQSGWNLMAYIHTAELIERGLLPKELDDMPDYKTLEGFKKRVLES